MAELTKAGVKRRYARCGVEKVQTPEMGAGTYTYVRHLPTPVYFEHEALFTSTPKGNTTAKGDRALKMAQICSLGICSKAGAPLYAVDQAQELLDLWPLPVLIRCVDVLNKLNGFDTDSKATAKNLPASQRVFSRSRSQKTLRKR